MVSSWWLWFVWCYLDGHQTGQSGNAGNSGGLLLSALRRHLALQGQGCHIRWNCFKMFCLALRYSALFKDLSRCPWGTNKQWAKEVKRRLESKWDSESGSNLYRQIYKARQPFVKIPKKHIERKQILGVCKIWIKAVRRPGSAPDLASGQPERSGWVALYLLVFVKSKWLFSLFQIHCLDLFCICVCIWIWLSSWWWYLQRLGGG